MLLFKKSNLQLTAWFNHQAFIFQIQSYKETVQIFNKLGMSVQYFYLLILKKFPLKFEYRKPKNISTAMMNSCSPTYYRKKLKHKAETFDYTPNGRSKAFVQRLLKQKIPEVPLFSGRSSAGNLGNIFLQGKGKETFRLHRFPRT